MGKSQVVFPTEAESRFNDILLSKGFATASLKQAVKAPSIEGDPGYIVIPDIIAVDNELRGWCFEVKDEKDSKIDMARIQLNRYHGPAWLLKSWLAESYLEFSQAFKCPCVIVIRDNAGNWRVDYFSKRVGRKIDYNRSVVAANWDDPRGIPILFNVMYHLPAFFRQLDETREELWEE